MITPTIQISVAMGMIPLGFIVLVLGVSKEDWRLIFPALGIIILGIISWYASLVNARKEERKDRKEREAFLKVIKSIDGHIKNLRKDLKANKGE